MTCTKPEGAFYVYPNVSKYLGKAGVPTAMELSKRLLHEAHVVTVPGEAFGTAAAYSAVVCGVACGCGGGAGADEGVLREAVRKPVAGSP